MHQSRWIRVIVAALALGGCASVQKINSQVFELEKLALISFYGPAEIDTPNFLTMEHVANAKSIRKQAPRVVVQAERALRKRLTSTLKLKLLDDEKVLKHKAYKKFPALSDAEDWVTANGMKAISLDKENDVALGELARALKVDGVLVVRSKWEVEGQQDERETSIHGYTWTDFLLVDAQGKRLVESGHTGRSSDVRWFTEDKGPADIGVGLFGTGEEPKQFEAVMESVEGSFDGFVDVWMESAPK